MLWLWIPGILAMLLLLLCLTRVGVKAQLAQGSAAVEVRVGLFHIRAFPGKENLKRAEKQAKKSVKDTEKKVKKRIPKPSFSDIREAGQMLWPPLRRALRRLGRGILITPLDLRITLGGAEDPAGAAQLYGWLQAAVWTGMPELEKLLHIRDPYLHIGLDFDIPDTAAEGTAGVSFRIGTLLAAAAGIGIPALKWFLRYQKRQKKAERSVKAAA